jgi:hypothetical protein
MPGRITLDLKVAGLGRGSDVLGGWYKLRPDTAGYEDSTCSDHMTVERGRHERQISM